MSLTSPESGFTPRREFLRDHQVTPNSFSLLAISGANCIRLYSFPLPLMTALRRLLDQQNLVTALREDVGQQLCEIALTGKPWTSAKSLATEKLLVEILAVIYLHGYTYLSTIDYGRESDDRLAMAFSKPAVRSLSPLSPSDSPAPASLSLNKQGKRIPFALSFASATMMRVIAPPLHSTPAILQAVRGAWPRGVVSEKKVGDNCFEFKLKGYKWFHEDTFATDSLRHILSLLSSLDAHSFSLLTSITLTSRSRVKDLWVFTGPAASSMDSLPESPAPSILNGSQTEFRRVLPGTETPIFTPMTLGQSQQSLHRRLASDPTSNGPVPHSHARAATDSPVRSSQSPTNVLRKAAPRAQVPVSVHDTDVPLQQGEVRANLPSIVPESVQDLTGIGASGRTPDVFYSTSPFRHNETAETPFPLLLPTSRSASPPSRGSSPRGGSPMGHASSRTPPLASNAPSSSSSSPHPTRTPPIERGQEELLAVQSDPSTPGTPPLLGPGAFRDSAFSSATNSTYEVPIPIKWTGGGGDSRDEVLNTSESGPVFPGGWQPTPIEEKPEDGTYEEPEVQHDAPTPDVQEVSHRVASPDLQAADLALRKSEAGLVGLIAASESQEVPQSPDASEGKGWVVVDVEGKGDGAGMPVVSSSEPQTPITPLKKSNTPLSASSNSGTGTPTQSPVPHAAKAIAIVDAIEAKNKSSSKGKSPSTDAPPGSIRRKLFSLGRKNSNPPQSSASVQEEDSESQQAPSKPPVTTEVSVDDTKRAIEMVHNASSQEKTKTKADKEKPATKSRLRDKLRLIGTPEASRNEHKRRSIH